MSEYGNHNIGVTLKATEKAVESTLSVILKILKFIATMEDKALDKAIKRYRVAEMAIDGTEKIEQAGALKELDKIIKKQKTSRVDSKLLVKTGKPLQTFNATFDDTEMAIFDGLAKKYGVIYGSISDQTVEGKKVHTFLVLEKDMHFVHEITERMTEKAQLRGIDKLIEEIKTKGELDPEDLQKIRSLELERSKIIFKSTKDMNSKSSKDTFLEVSGRMKLKSNSFDDALNRVTDKDFSNDKPYYVCNRTNPKNYIKLISQKDKFKGKEYTKTTYFIYKDDVHKATYDDGRFAGRPSTYWMNLKLQMSKEANFNDDMIYFPRQSEFERYKSLYAEATKEQYLDERISDFVEKDYEKAIESIEAFMEQRGVHLKEETFINVTDADMTLKEGDVELIVKPNEIIPNELIAKDFILAKNLIKEYAILNQYQHQALTLKGNDTDGTNINNYHELKTDIHTSLDKVEQMKSEIELSIENNIDSLFKDQGLNVDLKQRNYGEVIEKTELELSKLDVIINEHSVIDKETGLVVDKEMIESLDGIDDENIRLARAFVLKQQLDNYKTMSNIQFEIADATMSNNKELVNLKNEELNSYFEIEKDLVHKIQQLESITAINQVERDWEQSIEREAEFCYGLGFNEELGVDDLETSMSEWLEMIESEKSKVSFEKNIEIPDEKVFTLNHNNIER